MKVLFAGDFCPYDRVASFFEKEDYSSVLCEIKKVTDQADYSIINLECPIASEENKPISKIGPNLKCSEKGIKALLWAGFDCVTLANNHFYDYGDGGVANTILTCKKYGIDHVGGGENIIEASKVLYKQIEGKVLAIVNCCEREFSIATESTGGSNPLNPVQQYYSIEEARKKADVVAVIVHGGNEHYQLPSPRMKEVYRFFIDAGADMVVNHHQHCYSGYEIYNKKPIFYGLGNFCFDNPNHRNSTWNKGYMVMVDTERLDDFKVIPYNQCDELPKVSLINETESKHIHKEIEKLNTIIMDDNSLVKSYNTFLGTEYQYMLFGFEPYMSSRLFRALYIRKLLPSFLSKHKVNWLINFIGCESHQPKLLAALNNKKKI